MPNLIKNRKISHGFLTLVFNTMYLPHATSTLSWFTLTVCASINFLRPSQIHCSSRFPSLLHAAQHKNFISGFPHCSHLFAAGLQAVARCLLLNTQCSVLTSQVTTRNQLTTHDFADFSTIVEEWTPEQIYFLNIFLCLRFRFQFQCLFLKLFKHNIFHFIV